MSRIHTHGSSLDREFDQTNKRIAGIAEVPIGCFVFYPWQDDDSKYPRGYVPADGRVLSTLEYPEAFNVWGIQGLKTDPNRTTSPENINTLADALPENSWQVPTLGNSEGLGYVWLIRVK